MPSNDLSSAPCSRHGAPRAAARTLDFESDLFAATGETGDRTGRFIGTGLFWLAIAALVVARVVFFDPAVARPVGGFSNLIGAPVTAR